MLQDLKRRAWTGTAWALCAAAALVPVPASSAPLEASACAPAFDPADADAFFDTLRDEPRAQARYASLQAHLADLCVLAIEDAGGGIFEEAALSAPEAEFRLAFLKRGIDSLRASFQDAYPGVLEAETRTVYSYAYGPPGGREGAAGLPFSSQLRGIRDAYLHFPGLVARSGGKGAWARTMARGIAEGFADRRGGAASIAEAEILRLIAEVDESADDETRRRPSLVRGPIRLRLRQEAASPPPVAVGPLRFLRR